MTSEMPCVPLHPAPGLVGTSSPQPKDNAGGELGLPDDVDVE